MLILNLTRSLSVNKGDSKWLDDFSKYKAEVIVAFII